MYVFVFELSNTKIRDREDDTIELFLFTQVSRFFNMVYLTIKVLDNSCNYIIPIKP